jgi:hypothetical protein
VITSAYILDLIEWGSIGLLEPRDPIPNPRDWISPNAKKIKKIVNGGIAFKLTS